jgi:hypothetical protein
MRSKAAPARSRDGSGFKPVIVKDEPIELPMPAANSEGGSSKPFLGKGQGVSWSLRGPLCHVVFREERQ